MPRGLALSILLLAPSLWAGEKSAVTQQVVKYDGLGQAVLQNRGKVVLVDFWGDFCFPCKKAFPHMVDLHRKHAAEGLAVIAVAVDPLDDPIERKEVLQRQLEFLRKQGADFTNLALDESPNLWQEKLGIKAVPALFVFDRQGRWTRFVAGETMGIDYGAVDRLVLEFLREKSSK